MTLPREGFSGDCPRDPKEGQSGPWPCRPRWRWRAVMRSGFASSFPARGISRLLLLRLVLGERHLVHRIDDAVDHGLAALDVTRHARFAVDGRVQAPVFLQVVPDDDS